MWAGHEKAGAKAGFFVVATGGQRSFLVEEPMALLKPLLL
ncbi:hypothetical protein PA18A_590 [Pseudomonas aeruginosa 18A]|nr:hypothetical protein PA18A_590 [Pseudomonas aeruginosa 18A]CEI19074.1 hypothetical protein PAMH19_4724 [Pseudomonas aeruginosa]